jgi:hypothetical protein
VIGASRTEGLSARFTGSKCRSRVWISLFAKPILARVADSIVGRTYERKRSDRRSPKLSLQVGGRPHMNRAASVSPTGLDPARDRRNASPKALALRRRNLALGSVRHGYCASADSGRETGLADYASTGRPPRHISWRTRLARTRSAGVGRGFFVRSRTGEAARSETGEVLGFEIDADAI